MKIERRKLRTAEVYTASLNDIMFFLLLFFLIISTLVTPATISVLLPKSKTSENQVVKKQISLTITADHRYYVDNKEVTFETIEPQLLQLIHKKSTTILEKSSLFPYTVQRRNLIEKAVPIDHAAPILIDQHFFLTIRKVEWSYFPGKDWLKRSFFPISAILRVTENYKLNRMQVANPVAHERKKGSRNSETLVSLGRGSKIRTCDLLLPKQAR